jgi:shikimate kinase
VVWEGGERKLTPYPIKSTAFAGDYAQVLAKSLLSTRQTVQNAAMLAKGNIFLIGPMGSGKTAVGRHLARMLRFTFYDSDADIEAKTGVDIAFIFEKEGESGFRIREKESIERLTRLESIVLATGGGAVIDADNRRVLAERGVVVYLATSIDQQLERTRHARHRPLLNDTDPEQKLHELMKRRALLYAEIADFTVSTDGRRVQLVAEEIHHQLRRARASKRLV